MSENRPRYSKEEARRRYIRRQRYLRRRRILFIRRCIVLGVIFICLLAVILLAVNLFKGDKKKSKNDTVKKPKIEEEQIKEQVKEPASIPFTPILEQTGAELVVSWDGLREDDSTMVNETKTKIQTVIDQFTQEGFNTGFLLYDLNTGGGISYQPDTSFYAASSIKGVYVGWLAMEQPESAQASYNTIGNTISWSSNDDYFSLIKSYGFDGFNSWTTNHGAPDIYLSSDSWFSSATAREFASLWKTMYQGFTDGSIAENISTFYTGTLQSPIYDTLGSNYTVYSKAGWIGEGLGTYYHVQNDTGIVMKDNNPYVLIILSDAFGRLDLLNNLVQELDSAQTSLISAAQETK